MKASPRRRSAPWWIMVRQAGGKAAHFALPVGHHRGRADQQHRGREACPRISFSVQQQRHGLDGLAQAHIIGQAGAQAPVAEEAQPGIAIALVRAQLAGEAGRLGQLGQLARFGCKRSSQSVSQSSATTSSTGRSLVRCRWRSYSSAAPPAGQSRPRSSCFSQNLMAASTCSGSSCTHCPRICTSGALSAARARNSCSVSVVSPSDSSQWYSTRFSSDSLPRAISFGGGALRRAQAQAHAQAGAALVPPGRGEQAKTGLFQHRARLRAGRCRPGGCPAGRQAGAFPFRLAAIGGNSRPA